MMKKLMICVLSFVLVLSMAACGGKTENRATETDPETTEEILIGGDPATWGPAIGTEDGTAQIPNPWQECSTLEEAGKLAGVSFTAPETVEGFDETYIAAIPGDVAEVIFRSPEDENAQVMFRKGTGDEDISGDYNTYGKEEALSVSGCTITLKGNDDGCSLATWTDGTYAYSISVASPISGEAFRSLLERNF